MDRLSESVWRDRLARHGDRLTPFAADRTDRMARGEKHPVRDFLFEYYGYRPAQLVRWSPGVGVFLENGRPVDLSWGQEFLSQDGGLILPANQFPDHRRKFVRWAVSYLEGIADREPQFGCFGLHEWAMVYGETAIRHTKTPLRMSPEGIAAIVESEALCCTHFDAFRFFTLAAVPRNGLALTRETTDQFDQRGCVHVTMDLYRYAFKLSPWISGELIADTFLLAWEARELDMRASPYDLRSFGLEPITIETVEGKDEYVKRQKELAATAAPLRARLVGEYRRLLELLTAAR